MRVGYVVAWLAKPLWFLLGETEFLRLLHLSWKRKERFATRPSLHKDGRRLCKESRINSEILVKGKVKGKARERNSRTTIH